MEVVIVLSQLPLRFPIQHSNEYNFFQTQSNYGVKMTMQVHKKLNLRSLSANEHPYENSNFVKFIKLDKMHVSPF